MTSSPQTAIRGVASVATINLVARVLGYGKHLVITAYIGLTANLDAFYVAFTILSLFILSFGDVFDSLGVPRLVRALREEGEEGFRRYAGTLLTFSGLIAATLSLLLLALSPWTPWVAPGFTPEKKGLVLSNLMYLGPVVLLYLPYHAIGSVLRAKRRFRDYYLGELVNAVATLACLYAGRALPFIVPLSFSAGFAAASLYLSCAAGSQVAFAKRIDRAGVRDLLRLLLALLPFYLAAHLFPLVDRAFASYLSTGGVSALSYGFLIATIPSSILMIDNIFLTPLSESSDRGTLMAQILGGVVAVFVPVAVYLSAYAGPVVQAGLQRGAFTPEATRMTADALAYFSPAIPALIYWPVCYRLFQIEERLRALYALIVGAVMINVLFNALFLRAGMGVKGLALSTTIANYFLVAFSILLIRRSGSPVIGGKTLSLLGIVALVVVASLAVSRFAGPAPESLPGLLGCTILYFLSVVVLYAILPNEEIRALRRTVLQDLFRGRAGGNSWKGTGP